MTRNRSVLGGIVTIRTVEALASSAMLPFVVLWAHRYAGLGGIAAGLLFVGQAVGEFGGGVVGGGLADRLGHRRVLLVSTLGMALGYGLLAVANTPWLAVVLFLLAGVFESAFHPTTAAVVGAVTDDDRLEHAFSLVRVGSYAGRIVGPLLGALAALADLPAVFALSGGLLGLALLVELAVLPRTTPAEDEDEEPEIPPGTLRALRTDSRLLALVLGGGLLAVAFTWWESDGLVVVRQQTALGSTAYAALFTVAAAVVVAGQLPLNRLLRGLPAPRLLLGGALVQAGGLAVLTAAGGGYGWLVVAVVLMALGEMAYAPTVSAVVSRRARPHQRASYQAALSITEDIGTAVGPVSGLAVARATTAAGVWVVAAGLSAAAGALGRIGAGGAAAGPVRSPGADDAAGAVEPVTAPPS
jgi:MFS family permease